MNAQELTRDALALPLAERVALAEALWQSIDGSAPNAADEEKVALELARQRDAEMGSGAAIGRTHEQVMRAARGAIECD